MSSYSREGFGPLVVELSSQLDPVSVFERLAHQPHCVFLDSAVRRDSRGKYSYVAADPFHFMVADRRTGKNDPIPTAGLQRLLSGFTSELVEFLPPFQGGAAGLMSYDLGATLESLPPTRFDEFQLPVLAMGIYDVVVAFDHDAGRGWLISQGWPASDGIDRRRRAEQRAGQFLHWFEVGAEDSHDRIISTGSTTGLQGEHFPVAQQGEVLSNFSPDDYRRSVQRVIDYIHAGDVFQVNLAQRLVCPAGPDAVSLYLSMREQNPAPFAGFFDLGSTQIVSASPERFIKINDRFVETRPIKGTRRRTSRVEADLFSSDDLRQSQKDRAENVMIVDLMRNDLSRVCEPDSVVVSQLCEIEQYEYVQHLVSAVTGALEPNRSSIDLVNASFPGGSVTGAPKIRAMEIIAELEPHARGAYCGSMGYLNWDGSMDLNILIRTITVAGGWWQFPVGGGIVAQSDPDAELQETWHKAEGLLRGIESSLS